MRRELASFMLVSIIIFAILVPSTPSVNEDAWWNSNWSSRQDIILPINTSNKNTSYQPIDIHINFDESCWAKNEGEHSVRVIFQKNGNSIEIESQIYDLSYTDAAHINSCNIVFLVPKETDGGERYYIYYDSKEKSAFNYPDHVNVEESYYSYEPFPGFPFVSNYYKITEEGYIVYAIAQNGKFMDDSISQQVTKLKPKTETFMPKNGEQLASFGLTYWYLDNGKWNIVSTIEELVSKNIFVDGNLMVKFGITSRSADGTFQTTVIYKYYYCPTENKRIYAHVKHEVINSPPRGESIDAAYATLNSGGIKSSTIPDLNFGEIPPYLHLYNKDERVLTYNLNPYPERSWGEIVGRNECELGSYAWGSVDYGETGKANAIIFGSTDILKSGTNERDGIEILAFESKNVQIPGLEGYFAYVYLGRNTYDSGGKDNEIPKDLIVEFDAEFFSSENGGYKAVETEAALYQSLIRYQPQNKDNVTNGEEDTPKYALTLYTHLPFYLSSQLMLSRLSGNKPYVYAELYRDNELYASGRVGRLPLKNDFKLDWKNFSFFRKICFSNLPSGEYFVKIWLKNLLFGDNREFIGLQIIDLKENKTTHIFCKPEGKINLSIFDQYKNDIENASAYIFMNGFVVDQNLSDSNGKAVIRAPCSFRDKYTLKVFYKGFLVYEENVRVGFIRKIIPLEKKVNIEIYNLTIKINNENNASFDAELSVISDEMELPISIKAHKIGDGEYKFFSLYPAAYTLKFSYNLFEIEEVVHIFDDSSLEINLYNLKINVSDKLGLTPGVDLEILLANDEFKKPVLLTGKYVSDGQYLFTDLYPAEYVIKLFYQSFSTEKLVDIPYNENDGTYSLVFSILFNVSTKILDSRGNPIVDVKVVLCRDGEEIEGFTNEKGITIFSLPPGVYFSKIYSGNRLVAERKIDATSENAFDIVTNDQSVIYSIVIWLVIFVILFSAIFTYIKKDFMLFFKIFAIALLVIAVMLPWWNIDGSSLNNEVETSTDMYLFPTNLVTLTSTFNVSAGEVASLDSSILVIINLIPVLVAFGSICIASSIFFKRYSKRRLSFTVFLVGLVIFLICLLVFFNAMSELSEKGVGSFLGSGELDILIPGEERYATLSCAWGPGVGFYLFLFSLIVFVLIFVFDYVKNVGLIKRRT